MNKNILKNKKSLTDKTEAANFLRKGTAKPLISGLKVKRNITSPIDYSSSTFLKNTNTRKTEKNK